MTLDDLSQRFYINKYYLTKLFKQTYGVTVNSYLLQIRITRAKQLLRFTEQHSAMLTEFQETWFSAFAEQIILYDRNHIGFRLKCGLLLKEEI